MDTMVGPRNACRSFGSFRFDTNHCYGTHMRILKTALIVLAIGLAGTASANLKTVEVELPEGETKRVVTFDGAEPTILGIKLGDSKERVAEILEKEFGPEAMRVSQERMSTVVDGVAEVSSKEFLSGYSAYKVTDKQGNSIDVTFSSPMTGSRVIQVKRKLEFGGNNVSELPDYNAVEESVIKNYGVSTKVYFHLDGLQWQYVASGGKLAVRKDKCIEVKMASCSLYGVGASQYDELARLKKNGVEVIVSALVVGYGQKTGKARMLNVELKDVAGALESHNAVFDFLTSKGKAALKDGSGASPKIAF